MPRQKAQGEFRTIHVSEGTAGTAPWRNQSRLVTPSPSTPLRNADVHATSHEVISIFQVKPVRSDSDLYICCVFPGVLSV